MYSKQLMNESSNNLCKMFSAVTIEYGKPMVLQESEIPKPPLKGLVVKTAFSGVCHSDIHHWKDEFNFGSKRMPLVLGHEIAGEVYSMGEESDDECGDDLKIGDKVVVYPWIGCNECELCRGPSPNYCSTPPAHKLGIQIAGGYSNYVSVLSKRYAIKVPTATPMDMACMLPCSALTTFNGVEQVRPHVERFMDIKGKATLLIIGAGGLGLWCVQLARTVLPDVRILSCDVSSEKVKTTLEYGADDTVVWEVGCSVGNARDKVTEKNGGQRVEVIIDLVGSTSTVEKAMGAIALGGVVAIVGLFGGELQVSIPSLIFRAITIIPVSLGSIAQVRVLVKLLNDGKIKPLPLSYYGLSKINEVFDLLAEGKINGRALLKF